MFQLPSSSVVAEDVVKKITDKLVEKEQAEFNKIAEEFKKMESYINQLEERISKLENEKEKDFP